MSLISKISIWVMALALSFSLGMVIKGELLPPPKEISVGEERITLNIPRSEREWRKRFIGNASEKVFLEELKKMGFYQQEKK